MRVLDVGRWAEGAAPGWRSTLWHEMALVGEGRGVLFDHECVGLFFTDPDDRLDVPIVEVARGQEVIYLMPSHVLEPSVSVLSSECESRECDPREFIDLDDTRQRHNYRKLVGGMETLGWDASEIKAAHPGEWE